MRFLTAEEVLSISVSQARKELGDKGISKLLLTWHPDTNKDPRAPEVLQWLLVLRKKIKGEVNFEGVVFPTLVGRRWVEAGRWCFSFEKEPDLIDVFEKNLRSLPFADSKMRKQMELSVPRKIKRGVKQGEPVIWLPRRNGATLLDWLDVHGVPEPEHFAWIGSGLLNIVAWADWAKWVMPGISLESVVIDPQKHQVELVSGWEMASAPGSRPVVVSDKVLSLFPAIASPGSSLPRSLNLELVRQTLRDLAKDPAGQDLDKILPSSMVDWIQAPCAKSGIEDYKRWMEALEIAFGPRRFVKWAKSVDRVYPDI